MNQNLAAFQKKLLDLPYCTNLYPIPHIRLEHGRLQRLACDPSESLPSRFQAKDEAEGKLKLLHVQAEQQLRTYSDPASSDSCYFGGMTGSNLYRECTCLLVLGLNRFEPKDYISRTLALDTSSALSQRLLSALEAGITPPSLFSCSEVLETQDMVLAQDLVQLMFRTALRNHGGNEEIEVWLLQPPNGVLHFLEVYFGDCVIDESRELPESCKQAVTMNRVYTGNPTHAAQLLRFLHHWSGDSGLTPQDIRDATGLSPPQFKEAKKNKDVRAYFTQYIVTKGSGRNTIYYKKNSEILRNICNT